MERLARPVSDSESEKSAESDHDKKDDKKENEANGKTAPNGKTAQKVPPKPKKTSKPEKKKVEENLDDVLAEFGIDVGAIESGLEAAKKKKKPKDASAEGT